MLSAEDYDITRKMLTVIHIVVCRFKMPCAVSYVAFKCRMSFGVSFRMQRVALKVRHTTVHARQRYASYDIITFKQRGNFTFLSSYPWIFTSTLDIRNNIRQYMTTYDIVSFNYCAIVNCQKTNSKQLSIRPPVLHHCIHCVAGNTVIPFLIFL